MSLKLVVIFNQKIKQVSKSLLGSVIFYTVIPLPIAWANSWQRIARWASLVGLMIGGILCFVDFLFRSAQFNSLTCSAAVVASWIFITGGLHLDGAMDAADGLAVTIPEKRFEAMSDSSTGAFGAMSAVIIIVLKIVALNENSNNIWWLFLLAAGWARWGQTVAIALYPYAKKMGKGAFHKEHMQVFPDLCLSSSLILFPSIAILIWANFAWYSIIIFIAGCAILPLIPGYYFFRKLQGQTGDTYGAIVEWSEVLLLLWMSRF